MHNLYTLAGPRFKLLRRCYEQGKKTPPSFVLDGLGT